MKVTFLAFQNDALENVVTAVAVEYNPETTEFERIYADRDGVFDSNYNAGQCWAKDTLSSYSYGEVEIISEIGENDVPAMELEQPELPKKYSKFKSYLMELVEQYQSKRTLRGLTAISSKYNTINIPIEMFFERGINKMCKGDITDELVIELRDAISNRQKAND